MKQNALSLSCMFLKTPLAFKLDKEGAQITKYEMKRLQVIMEGK